MYVAFTMYNQTTHLGGVILRAPFASDLSKGYRGFRGASKNNSNKNKVQILDTTNIESHVTYVLLKKHQLISFMFFLDPSHDPLTDSHVVWALPAAPSLRMTGTSKIFSWQGNLANTSITRWATFKTLERHSIESWLVDRDLYNGLLIIFPIKNGVSPRVSFMHPVDWWFFEQILCDFCSLDPPRLKKIRVWYCKIKGSDGINIHFAGVGCKNSQLSFAIHCTQLMAEVWLTTKALYRQILNPSNV